jgi:peptidoglycan/xylan/chitin deacetylase (PgdA/CDA1 family)
VDVVAGWPAFALMRVGELVRRREMSRAAAVIAAITAHVGRNPVRLAVDELLTVEREQGVRSTWFFLTGTPSFATWRRGDITYAIESKAARGIVDAVREADGEVALHGSFDSLTEPETFERERRRLAAVGGRVEGARQHFLRMRPGRTQAAMAGAGLLYDASYGFTDRNGFRLGVADVVPAWNDHEGREDHLELVPLVWMDRVLSKHQRMESPAALAVSAVESAEACRAVEGLWVGLWHPNMTAPLGFPGAAAAYRDIVERLCRTGPYVATLAEIAEWRRARRALRARRVGPDGRVELDQTGHGGHRFVLRDETGRAV